MRKFLSIVIPSYKETEQQVFPLLASIAGQVGIDFDDVEVILVRDGGGRGPFDSDFLSIFPLDIRQLQLDSNQGPGMARQAGIDAAKGTYIMCCDADDRLHNVGVLGAMIQEAEKTVPDLLYTGWIEEVRNDNTGEFVYLPHERDNTWMHGKFLRRIFLRENNIRHHPELRVHEDSYLLCIAEALAANARYLPITSYVWKWGADSITRRNGGSYSFDSIPTFVRACCLAHKELAERVPQQMEWKVVQLAAYLYFSLHRPEWQTPDHADYLKAAEEAVSREMAPLWRYWINADPAVIGKAYTEERQKHFNGLVETETLAEWLDRLGLAQNQPAKK